MCRATRRSPPDIPRATATAGRRSSPTPTPPPGAALPTGCRRSSTWLAAPASPPPSASHCPPRAGRASSLERRPGTAEHHGRKDSVTLEAQVLGDNAVRAADGGYEVDLHLAWYRSLPLSCLEGIDLTIDDETAPRESLKVTVGDRAARPRRPARARRRVVVRPGRAHRARPVLRRPPRAGRARWTSTSPSRPASPTSSSGLTPPWCSAPTSSRRSWSSDHHVGHHPVLDDQRVARRAVHARQA